MNNVVLVGRLTRDPELKRTNSDIAFVNFTIAINRTYTNRQGEREADFINCVAWRVQAENLARYMRKGSLIGVTGQIQTRSYDDQGGVRRFITEVICDSIQFLEPRSARSDYQSGYSEPQYRESSANYHRDSYQSYDSNYQKQEKQESKNPFEDIRDDFNVSNDDLPF